MNNREKVVLHKSGTPNHTGDDCVNPPPSWLMYWSFWVGVHHIFWDLPGVGKGLYDRLKVLDDNARDLIEHDLANATTVPTTAPTAPTASPSAAPTAPTASPSAAPTRTKAPTAAPAAPSTAPPTTSDVAGRAQAWLALALVMFGLAAA